MASTVAIVHYCEGAGHATRMLAIARALDKADIKLYFAGGGPGSRFIALNGYDTYEPTTVNYITEYQHGTLRELFTGSIRDSVRRTSEIVDWLDEIDPDVVVTDDMFAVMAAVQTGIPHYVVKHDVPSIYEDHLERFGAQIHWSLQVSTARKVFYPTLWDATSATSDEVICMPPLALDASNVDVPTNLDIVVVPSHYSDLHDVADQLRDSGKNVIHVGTEEWKPVSALLPFLREADVVVCSGYSTVKEAAVAGTPCVVVPVTDEQKGVARRLRNLNGFSVVADSGTAAAAAQTPPPAPEYENSAALIANNILSDLRTQRYSAKCSKPMMTRRGTLSAALTVVGTPLVGTTAVSTMDGRKSYSAWASYQATESLDRTVATALIQKFQTKYGGYWPADVRQLEPMQFEGGTANTIRLDEQYERITDPVPIHAIQLTFTLDGEGADYRHWLWMGVDTSDARVRTGVLRRHLHELEPRSIRLSFVPAADIVDRVTVFSPETTENHYAAVMPGENLPKYSVRAPPEGAATVAWHGTNSHIVSLTGMCETSRSSSTNDGWPDSQWEVACNFRPNFPDT